MQYTQEPLFPDNEVIGTGRPYPWNSTDETPAPVCPFQVESLFDEDAVKDAA